MDTLKYKKYLLKIRNALLSHNFREFLFFLFFLLISASFWLLQALNDTFDVELRFPLKLTGVPSNIVVTADLPSDLDVVVRDKGVMLVRYLYGYKIAPISVDYKDFDDGMISGRVLVPMKDIQNSIQNQLVSSTKIVSIRPDTLEFYFNRGAWKKVPVRLAGIIETSPEYYLERIKCTPDSVTVYAPLDILDTITAAVVTPFHVTNLAVNTKYRRSLQKVRGTKFVPSQVDVDMRVDLYTEKTVEVPVVGINFPASKDLRTFPSKVSVKFRVGMSHFKEVTADDFVIAVSYEELMENKTSKVALHLKSMPEGVSNVSIQPEEVDYLIEQIDDDE